MAYTQLYEASQPDSLFSPADLSHQLTSSHPMDPNHHYSSAEAVATEPSFDMYDDRLGYSGTGMTNTDEAGDPASRPRLTQEQLAQLERQFALHHKPNTEYKKSLAENMGVDYSKVNVSYHTICVTSFIDIGHRTGFRTDELKQNMRSRPSSDLIHRSRTRVISYPKTSHPWTIEESPDLNLLFITRPQSRVLCHQRNFPLASTSAA